MNCLIFNINQTLENMHLYIFDYKLVIFSKELTQSETVRWSRFAGRWALARQRSCGGFGSWRTRTAS
jgi:hypothetical protein